MGLLDFFIRRKPTKRRRSTGCNITGRQQIAGNKGQLDLIDSVLKEHRKDIDENAVLLKEHSQKLTNLEDILTNQPIPPTNLPERPVSTIKPVQANLNNKFDIDKFSPQEKKILSVFFNHLDMALSYRDIASTLGKASNTVKNQIHQILLKADIFEKSIDTGMVNRFRLKDGLKIEKYLTNRAD